PVSPSLAGHRAFLQSPNAGRIFKESVKVRSGMNLQRRCSLDCSSGLPLIAMASRFVSGFPSWRFIDEAPMRHALSATGESEARGDNTARTLPQSACEARAP